MYIIIIQLIIIFIKIKIILAEAELNRIYANYFKYNSRSNSTLQIIIKKVLKIN